MLEPLIATAHGLIGRALPTLLALQDAARAPARTGGQSGGQQSGGGGSPLAGLALPLLMVAFLYFFMIRPMNKQRKEQESLNKALKKGDRVVTNAGIIGTISGIDDRFVTIEIAEKVRVKFLRDAITRKIDEAAEAAKAAGEKGPSSTTTPAEAKK